MSRSGLFVIAGLLFATWLVLGWVMRTMEMRLYFAPTGQKDSPALQKDPPGYAPYSGPPFFEITDRSLMPEGLAHLQFVADAVRCPVSSRSAVMASCVVERYVKMRDKALLWRATYERLEGLERAYWAALAREGLTQRVEHVPTGKVAP